MREKCETQKKKLQDFLLDHNNIIDPVVKLFYDLNIGCSQIKYQNWSINTRNSGFDLGLAEKIIACKIKYCISAQTKSFTVSVKGQESFFN